MKVKATDVQNNKALALKIEVCQILYKLVRLFLLATPD